MLVSKHICRVPPLESIASTKGGHAVAMGKERTKEQLYNQAKRHDIKGRSKMNKGQLKAAITKRGY